MAEDLTRPIIGIENRTAQEVFDIMCDRFRRSAVSAERPGDAILSLATYNAGLLSDHGGGNVSWWQDYIRAELAYAHDFYQAQVDAYWPLSAVPATPEGEDA